MFACLNANLVLNEVMYNPFPDKPVKWIEILNTSDKLVNLDNWTLESGGEEFTVFYTFSDISIFPGEYIVIADSYEVFVDIVASKLVLFDEEGVTNGLRLRSPDNYTDTVLYGQPNNNNLPDDLYTFGLFFAPLTPAGSSLVRFPDGIDTDNNLNDWKISTYPTPGYPNVIPLELAIYDAFVKKQGSAHSIYVVIHNLSTTGVTAFDTLVKLVQEETVIDHVVIEEIEPQQYSEIVFTCVFPQNSYNMLEVVVGSGCASVSRSLSFISGRSPLVFNEILFKDSTENQEWIEVYNRTGSFLVLDELIVEDFRERKTVFSGTVAPGDYLVICRDKYRLLEFYPNANPEKIVESVGWAVLNNDYDYLVLRDSLGTVFDIKEYSFSASYPHDITIERVNPYDDNSLWDRSIAKFGGTPTEKNSIFFAEDIEEFRLSFSNNPFIPSIHEYLEIYIDIPEPVNLTTCRIFDLKGRKVSTVANQEHLPAGGRLIWHGFSDDGFRLKPGIYILLLEVYGQSSNRIYKKKTSFVMAH